MNRREILNGAAAVTLGAAVASTARSDAAVLDTNTPWPLRGSESFRFDSKAVGDSLAVGVWKPDLARLEGLGISVAQDQPLDLVYVLDGSWALAIAATICQLQLLDLVKPGFPPLLLVGIDYLEDKPNARTRDYTHNDLATPLAPGELPAEQTIGGADRFLKFLEDELDPMIRARYPVNDEPAGILGDSYGGTFTFHAFRRQSKLFNKYFLGSPGLFDTEFDYIAQVKSLLEGELIHDTKIYLSFGALEAGGGVSFYEEMGRNYMRLVSTLTTTPNDQLTFRSKIYPGHTHTTILAPALNDALLYLYGPHMPSG